MLAVGNDEPWQQFCSRGLAEPAGDLRFGTNEGRMENCESLRPRSYRAFRSRTNAEWVKTLNDAGVPYG